MAETIECMISPTGVPSVVEIRWTKALEDGHRPLLRDLATAIEAVHGVEEVILYRYSMKITYARHVTRTADLIAALSDVFSSKKVLEHPTMRLLGVKFVLKVCDAPILRVP